MIATVFWILHIWFLVFLDRILKVVKYVQDRPYNDFYYSTDTQKLKNLGWSPSRKLSSDAEDLFPTILAYLKDIRKEI